LARSRRKTHKKRGEAAWFHNFAASLTSNDSINNGKEIVLIHVQRYTVFFKPPCFSLTFSVFYVVKHELRHKNGEIPTRNRKNYLETSENISIFAPTIII
jgi:hypothetical protein